jgi:hypothetical protein
VAGGRCGVAEYAPAAIFQGEAHAWLAASQKTGRVFPCPKRGYRTAFRPSAGRSSGRPARRKRRASAANRPGKRCGPRQGVSILGIFCRVDDQGGVAARAGVAAWGPPVAPLLRQPDHHRRGLPSRAAGRAMPLQPLQSGAHPHAPPPTRRYYAQLAHRRVRATSVATPKGWERAPQPTLDLERKGRPPGLGATPTPRPFLPQPGPARGTNLVSWGSSRPEPAAPGNMDDSSPNPLDAPPRSR